MAFKNPIDQNVLELMPIETAPKDGTHILLYGELEDDSGIVFPYEKDRLGIIKYSKPKESIKGFFEGYWEQYDEWYHIGSYPAYPTHWMPLPKGLNDE